MHIRHSNPATTTLGHDGHEFTALRDGIFEVPDHIGEELIRHGVWSRHVGEEPYEVGVPAAATQESEEPPTDWYRAGQQAAGEHLPRGVPDGLHPRSREARDFLRGYDAAAKEPATAG
jgi:hypothetical protein